MLTVATISLCSMIITHCQTNPKIPSNIQPTREKRTEKRKIIILKKKTVKRQYKHT